MLRDEYDFGMAFAQELHDLHGLVLPMRKPYPSIPNDWQERMENAGVGVDSLVLDEIRFWQGYNDFVSTN